MTIAAQVPSMIGRAEIDRCTITPTDEGYDDARATVGYEFWSGIGSDVGELTILGLVAVWWRTHNCHIHRCGRISWHPHPVHGHPVCRKHYPNHTEVGKETA
jgi:hypothetical protein